MLLIDSGPCYDTILNFDMRGKNTMEQPIIDEISSYCSTSFFGLYYVQRGFPASAYDRIREQKQKSVQLALGRAP